MCGTLTFEFKVPHRAVLVGLLRQPKSQFEPQQNPNEHKLKGKQVFDDHTSAKLANIFVEVYNRDTTVGLQASSVRDNRKRCTLYTFHIRAVISYKTSSAIP